MSLKGLSEEELFDLKRSIGNNKSGFDPALGPKEVAAILEKAEKCGNSTKEISKFKSENQESGTTMITRTKGYLKNSILNCTEKLFINPTHLKIK